MAEVTAFRNNALGEPVYGLPFTLKFPLKDADGIPQTGLAGLDSEVSNNGDDWVDCTNEATEIGTSGEYYLTLTAAELSFDCVGVRIKNSGTAKQLDFTLNPKKLIVLRSGTCQGGAAGYVTLDASAGAKDDIWNGCVVAATIDSGVQVRMITDYDGTNQQATVHDDWTTNPDSDDTFVIYLPDGRLINDANIVALNSVAASGSSTLDANVVTVEPDVITDIQNGLATAAALATAQGNITSILGDTNELQTDWANGGRLDLLLDTLIATTLLTRQIVGNKHTVVESPSGTFTISVRNDADDATVRTIVYIPATGARTVS